MIDITINEPIVISSRQEIQKEFNIDVTIDGETHNLEINIFHTEDADGSNADFDKITMSNFTFTVSAGNGDVGLDISEHLESWFDNIFPDLEEKETKEDFNNIFGTVWEYIEEKGLY